MLGAPTIVFGDNRNGHEILAIQNDIVIADFWFHFGNLLCLYGNRVFKKLTFSTFSFEFLQRSNGKIRISQNVINRIETMFAD